MSHICLLSIGASWVEVDPSEEWCHLGLDYLHSKSIIHLDIKGANLLISMEGCVKISELGSARPLESSIYIYVSKFFLLTPGMEHTT
ncbi:hypothetical protein ARMGADRAFT_921283 [Armillaria gallica]|uniref:Protein kinase domain-containing protein n=1 Tax=Armillaria gallica TaxID=47427 RepID=A0A2H3DXM8_ARMGA|nr:hypothetical protein ARMGADRAFT_921283 [Armillaria gallica]